jgi:two-component system, LuxR family, response regulator FixJ
MISPTTSNAPEPVAPSSSMGHIFLVDDNDGFRRSTLWLLEGHGYQVDAFASPSHFLAFIDTLPDPEVQGCVLLDIRMPEMSGLQVQDALRERGNALPIVFISGHGDVPLAVEAMRKGAMHFLEKPFTDSTLIDALRDAMERSQAQQKTAAEPDDELKARMTSLTARERQVLDLVIEGMLNKVIADRLGISIKTVELHRSRVMSKMKAKSIAQLVQFTMRAR